MEFVSHFVWEAVGTNLVTLDYIPTAEMTADIMMKAPPERNIVSI
jgi:hypothetical protein